MKRLTVIFFILLALSFFILFQFTKMKRINELDFSENSSSLIYEDFDPSGRWYTEEWDKYLEINKLEKGYNFYFTDDTTNDDVMLVKQNKDIFIFQSIEKESRIIYEINPISNNKFTYKAKTSDVNGIGQTRMVTFKKQEE